MNADRIKLIRAIETAQAELDRLKAGIYPSSVNNIRAQAESAERYADHARDIVEITGNLRFDAVSIVAELGNQHISERDRAEMRDCDIIHDILSDVASWAEEQREYELEAAE